MEQIHSGLPSGEFTKPEDIVEVQVCSKSGKLPVEGLCDQDPRGSCIITEYFAADNQPTESCDTHVRLIYVMFQVISLTPDAQAFLQEYLQRNHQVILSEATIQDIQQEMLNIQ